MTPRSGSTVSDLVVHGVTKRFGPIVAVDDVSFQIPHGEVLALLGPSGSGKTTLLAMAGGQLSPDAGDISIGGRSVVGLPPDKIDTATVFQDYALFPHMTVAENIGFGLEMQGLPRRDVTARVAEMLRLVHLEGFEQRKVTELSGGQRQRVATARALAVRPRVVLMDEPLGALDRQIRLHLQEELHDLLHRLHATTLVVTHDQHEAFAMADRVAVMQAGHIEQLDTPVNLYRAPESEFVATFLGDGTLLDAEVIDSGAHGTVVEAAGARFQCRGAARAGRRVRVLVRPEHVRLVQPGTSGAEWPQARVARAAPAGETTRFTLDLGQASLVAVELGTGSVRQGADVGVRLTEDGPFVIPRSAEHES